jgi:hypothetical protein
MTESTLPGPCAGYEFEIVELHEGVLGPEEAQRVGRHVEACACCRDWQTRYALLDAALAREMPFPVLPEDFGAKLRKRIEGLADPATRRAQRAVAESEYDRMLRALKRRLTRQALAAAAAGVATAAACTAVFAFLGPHAAALLQILETGNGHVLLGAIGVAAAIGALAWSASRGMLPGVPSRR